jgi:eukaryotic-like serine/threonine-protein kinase
MDILGDRYQLQEPISHSGSGTIYRAQDVQTDQVVAVKMLRDVDRTDPKFVRRFQQMSKMLEGLPHPSNVQVYDYGQTDGRYYIVMELVEESDPRLISLEEIIKQLY